MIKYPIGVGLRPPHYPYLREKPALDLQFFEVIVENVMDSFGYPREMLLWMREQYPISFHGVSLSLGSLQRPDRAYLKKLSSLVDVVDPFLISDHLCWTGQAHNQAHNLLPLCYDDTTLNRLVDHLQEVQDHLQRPFGVENLSAYFQYQHSTYSEWDFFALLAKRSGCFLLLDINNIYVNAKNHGFSPYHYLDAIPAQSIGEVHLAGFSDMGSYLFDTHSQPVHPDVWDLLRYKAPDLQRVPILIEWDDQIPPFEQLYAEALKARAIMDSRTHVCLEVNASTNLSINLF
jgi:uncharacterized protein (UPF0276 family)